MRFFATVLVVLTGAASWADGSKVSAGPANTCFIDSAANGMRCWGWGT